MEASLMAQIIKNLPAMQEIQVWSLGWEDPLKKGIATHSSILAWTFPWTKEPDGPQFMGSQRIRHDWVTNTHACNQADVYLYLRVVSHWKFVLWTQSLPLWQESILKIISLENRNKYTNIYGWNAHRLQYYLSVYLIKIAQ